MRERRQERFACHQVFWGLTEAPGGFPKMAIDGAGSVSALTFYCGCLFSSMEKAMATHSSTLAWKIPWTEGPGGLQSLGSLGVGHD